MSELNLDNSMLLDNVSENIFSNKDTKSEELTEDNGANRDNVDNPDNEANEANEANEDNESNPDNSDNGSNQDNSDNGDNLDNQDNCDNQSNEINNESNDNSDTNDITKLSIKYPYLNNYIKTTCPDSINLYKQKIINLLTTNTTVNWIETCLSTGQKESFIKLYLECLFSDRDFLGNNLWKPKLPSIVKLVRTSGILETCVLVNYDSHNALFYPLEEYLNNKDNNYTYPYEKGKFFCFEITDGELEEIKTSYPNIDALIEILEDFK